MKTTQNDKDGTSVARTNIKHSVASILAKPSKIIQVPWKVPKRGKKQRNDATKKPITHAAEVLRPESDLCKSSEDAG